MQDLVLYILVNKDIEISRGKLSGQVGHACATFMYGNIMYNDEFSQEVLRWFEFNDQKKIIVGCSQKKLEEYERISSSKDVQIISIRDKGYTELEPNTLTCVAIGLIDRNNIPEEFKFLKKLQLLK